LSFLAKLKPGSARRGHTPWLAVHAGEAALLGALRQPTRDGKRPAVRLLAPQAVPARASALRGWRDVVGRRARANVVLRTVEYRVLPVEPPPLPAAELREALRWQVAEALDFPVEDAAIDLLALPAGTASGGRDRRFVVAAPNEHIARWVTTCKEAELPLAAVDIPEMAMRNLSVLAAEASAHAFLYVGIRSTRLALVWQRELCSFRQLEISGQQLVSLPEHERAGVYERLALEIQRTADSFSRQFSGIELEALWLNSVVQPEAMADALATQIAQRVHLFDIADHVDIVDGGPVLDLPLGRDHLLAIGGALRDDAA